MFTEVVAFLIKEDALLNHSFVFNAVIKVPECSRSKLGTVYRLKPGSW